MSAACNGRKIRLSLKDRPRTRCSLCHDGNLESSAWINCNAPAPFAPDSILQSSQPSTSFTIRPKCRQHANAARPYWLPQIRLTGSDIRVSNEFLSTIIPILQKVCSCIIGRSWPRNSSLVATLQPVNCLLLFSRSVMCMKSTPNLVSTCCHFSENASH